MIHKICLHANVPGEKIGEKTLRKLRIPMEKCHHCLLGHTKDCAPLNCTGRGHAELLACEAALAQKTAIRQDSDDGFLAMRAHNREFHFAALDEEHCIRDVALQKTDSSAWYSRLDFPTESLASRGCGSNDGGGSHDAVGLNLTAWDGTRDKDAVALIGVFRSLLSDDDIAFGLPSGSSYSDESSGALPSGLSISLNGIRNRECLLAVPIWNCADIGGIGMHMHLPGQKTIQRWSSLLRLRKAARVHRM